jgi:hypothetical protein
MEKMHRRETNPTKFDSLLGSIRESVKPITEEFVPDEELERLDNYFETDTGDPSMLVEVETALENVFEELLAEDFASEVIEDYLKSEISLILTHMAGRYGE